MRAGLFFVVVAIVAAGAFYLGTQAREPAGPGERFGKALDETATEASERFKSLAEDVEDAFGGDGDKR